MTRNFGQGVRSWRRRLGLSIADLATRSRIPWQTLEEIEDGRRFPPLHELERLVDALGRPFRDIIEDPPMGVHEPPGEYDK